MTIFCSSIRKARTIFSLQQQMKRSERSHPREGVLSPDSLVAEDTSVGTEHSLLPPAHAGLLLKRDWKE